MPRARILVVDDEPEVRALLSQFLEGQGYDVRDADTAVAALREFREWRPDVVLLDLNMPGAIRGEAIVGAMSPEAPVIIVTAEFDVEIARQTLRDGAFDFVMKPFQLVRLGEIVELALLHRRGGGTS